MISFIDWFGFMALIILSGMWLGYVCKRDMQKTNCGYCSCKDCCRIGMYVEQKCSDEELKPFVCMDGR